MTKRIIVPNDSGVSNIEIKRMQKEHDATKPTIEVEGHIPADAKVHAIEELKKTLKAFEEDKVSSMLLVVMFPLNSMSSMVAATVCCNDFDFDRLACVTTMALEARDPEPGDPDGKAG